MSRLNTAKKMEITKRTLDRLCGSSNINGLLTDKSLRLSQYLDILVVKQQCNILGIRGIKNIGNSLCN